MFIYPLALFLKVMFCVWYFSFFLFPFFPFFLSSQSHWASAASITATLFLALLFPPLLQDEEEDEEDEDDEERYFRD